MTTRSAAAAVLAAVLVSASAAGAQGTAQGTLSPGTSGQASPSQGSAGKSARAPATAGAVSPGISCPGDAVVWVNLRSHGYHMQGDKFFGHTKRGKFMCKKAADAAGDHEIKPGEIKPGKA